MQELEQSKEFVKRSTIKAKRLNKVLDYEKLVGEKRGLGYVNKHNIPSSLKSIEFVKPSNMSSSHTTLSASRNDLVRPSNPIPIVT